MTTEYAIMQRMVSRLLGRIGVDVVHVRASLAVTLDTPAEKVEAVINMGDQSLLLRQAQSHRGQDLRDLLPPGFGVFLGALDDQAPVVGIAHQLERWQATPQTPRLLDRSRRRPTG
jgi:hypothetical protein